MFLIVVYRKLSNTHFEKFFRLLLFDVLHITCSCHVTMILLSGIVNFVKIGQTAVSYSVNTVLTANDLQGAIMNVNTIDLNSRDFYRKPHTGFLLYTISTLVSNSPKLTGCR